jgi:hypothetical protein
VVEQCAEQERVSRRGGVAGMGEDGTRARKSFRYYRGDRAGPQRFGPYGWLGRYREELVEQIGLGGRLTGPHGAEHGQRELGQLPAQTDQPPQRRRVRPVHVIDDHERGSAFGQSGGEPGQAMCGGVHRVIAADRLGLVGVEGTAGQGGGAGGDALPLLARDEELARDPPTGVRLQGTPRRPQRPHAAGLGHVGDGRDQARFADARRTIDDDHTAGAGPDLAELPPQAGQLGVALEQHTGHAADRTPTRSPANR